MDFELCAPLFRGIHGCADIGGDGGLHDRSGRGRFDCDLALKLRKSFPHAGQSDTRRGSATKPGKDLLRDALAIIFYDQGYVPVKTLDSDLHGLRRPRDGTRW